MDTCRAFCILTIALCSGWYTSAGQDELLTFRDESGKIHPVKRARQWEIKRKQILDGMQQAMGDLPAWDNLPEIEIRKEDSLIRDHYTRYTIRYKVRENEEVPAFLYIPLRVNAKLPAMLALHGTGDAGKELVDGKSPLANRALARELAQRGYVVLAPDYPSMGQLKDYDFENDLYESGTMKAIFNHMRGVDLLQQLPEVDPQRIGVIGHSLGGHNAMFVGAFDTRLKVVVSSCGWTLMEYYNIGEEGSRRYGGRLGPWAQDRYMPLLRARYQLDGDKFPFDFDGVIAAIAPRPFFSNSPVNDSNFDVNGVKKGIESASAVYGFFRAGRNLQVHYPAAGHDFPREVRLKAYQFVDDVLRHHPTVQTLSDH